jgi:hypothetical protein
LISRRAANTSSTALGDDEQARRHGKNPSEGKEALLAAGQRAGQLAPADLQVREALVGPLEGARRLPAGQLAAKRQPEVVLHVQGCEHRPTLRCEGEAVAHDAIDGHAGDVLTAEQHRTGRRGHEAGDYAGDRRLAGPVRSEHGGDRALGDTERDVEQGPETTVRGMHVPQLERRRRGSGHVHFPSPR